jgi:hypothetical protein
MSSRASSSSRRRVHRCFVWAFSEAPLCRAPRRIPSRPAPQSATRGRRRARAGRRDASDASATRVRREPSTGRARATRARRNARDDDRRGRRRDDRDDDDARGTTRRRRGDDGRGNDGAG